MLNNLSKLFTVQLAPLFAFTSVLLMTFSLLGPVPVFKESIALASIVPGTTSSNVNSIRSRSELFIERASSRHSNYIFRRRLPRSAAERVVARNAELASGPVVRFGLLGSCFSSAGDKPTCTPSSLEPTYDLSSLPSGTPKFIQTPPSTTPGLLLTSLVMALLYVIVTVMPSVPKMPPSVANVFSKPAVVKLGSWLGMLAFLIGFVTTMVLRINFGSDVDNFNSDAETARIMLKAELNNGFTMLWVSFALLVPPVILSLFRHHLEANTKA